jgi:phospho-N-acetylmuramoyl-pentapeptide-transferase
MMPLWILAGFAIAAIVGGALVAGAARTNLRQRAYELAPATHREKSGTPTMGGLVFAAAILAMAAACRTPLCEALAMLVIACAAVGVIDDALSIRGTPGRGLRARTKFLLTALIATIFLRWLDASPSFAARDSLVHAGSFWLLAPHWLWFLLGICAVTATIHAVNLTDGLDGLAAGTMIPPLIVFGVIAVQSATPPAAIASSLGVGACAGFLLFNRHPARLFMGDTGSLSLGALLSGVAILTGEMLLLLLVGGVFVAEALSVIVQVSYFKTTGGKRVLRMSPLHHHFELGGLPETKVTARFWLASLLCSLLGWSIVR